MSTTILVKLKDIEHKIKIHLQILSFDAADILNIKAVFALQDLKLTLPEDATKRLVFNLYVYSLLSVTDLKLKLRDLTLKVSGVKSELLLRLVEHLKEEIIFSDEILAKILYELCTSSGIYHTLPQILDSDVNFSMFIDCLKKPKKVKDMKDSKSEVTDDSTSSLNALPCELAPLNTEKVSAVPDSLQEDDDNDTLNSSESELKSDSDSDEKIANFILNKVKADKLQVIAQSICNKKISKKDDCISAIINSYEENSIMFTSIKYYVLYTCERETLALLASDFKVTNAMANEPIPKIIRLIVENATVEYSKKKKLAISPAIRNEMWELYFPKCTEGVCFACNQIIVCHGNRSNTYQAGHVLAEANGGLITLENLRPVCKTCNTKMGVKHMLEYAKEIGVFNARIIAESS